MTAKLLELKSLTKKFGGIFAVYDLSFHVDEGESLGLIGPNGSGKSNFIDFFSFLHEISKGRLQHFIEYQGGADKILHLGSKLTKKLIGSITSSDRRTFWEFKLFISKVDKLLFYEEEISL